MIALRQGEKKSPLAIQKRLVLLVVKPSNPLYMLVMFIGVNKYVNHVCNIQIEKNSNNNKSKLLNGYTL